MPHQLYRTVPERKTEEKGITRLTRKPPMVYATGGLPMRVFPLEIETEADAQTYGTEIREMIHTDVVVHGRL